MGVQPVQQIGALAHQPRMPREQVSLVRRPVGVKRNSFRVMADGPPEVRHVTVRIIDSLDPLAVRRTEQHRGRTGERLHVVVNLPEGGPHGLAGERLPAEPWERRREGSG